MSCSRCRRSSLHWRFRIAASSTGCCSVPLPKPCRRTPGTRNTWVRSLAVWRCFTPGDRTLLAHPHLHCVIPGGGISPDGKRWVSCRDGFFLPVRVMSRMFRGKFLALLQRAFEQQELEFHGQLLELAHPKAWEGWVDPLRNKEWVVAFRRSHPSAQVPRPLHQSGRHREPTHPIDQQRQSQLQLEGLRPRQSKTHHDPELRGIYSAFPSPRSSLWIHAYPLLRLFRQPPPSGENRACTNTALRANELSGKRPRKPRASQPQADATGEPIDDFDICPKCKQGRLVIFLRVGFFFARKPWSFDSS